MLRKLLFNILALLIFNACEDKTSLKEPDSLIGSWNYNTIIYDYYTFFGEGEINDSGTIDFSNNNATFKSTESFEEWCEGIVIEDTICDWYDDSEIVFKSDWEYECENEFNGIINENECYISDTIEYTISDSLYFVENYDGETINIGFKIDIDGDIATLKRIDYEWPRSVLIELTRQ
tara:strand:- start:553 stop:1083 length:531 start_codon:yes stop_codon:yes gene_type:complete